ncbi:Arylamine N-acetyltransferase [Phlyctema vagabunda]|uniref:Arylamine N-acetyltransferase n=1 Tax=Phlyctema vagabunda TaxID=108571 RepID=A0ABR4PPG1_9HELO
MSSAYSPAQIAQYEAYIALPSHLRLINKPSLTASYLTTLHVHQLSKVPYENLQLHYSPSHAISLDPNVLFRKIVIDARGRGGYCMENSIFYNHILKALGFDAYTVGVRIRARYDGIPRGDYIGWVHIVNIVTLPNGERYMVDVGFGGDGATQPLPLIPNQATTNLGTQEVRLIRDFIPTQTRRQDEKDKLWIYQYRNGTHLEWNSFFAFPETEFLPQDFEVMNFYTSQSFAATNFQTRRLLIVLFLKGEEGEQIVGKVMLVNGEVKRNDGGKTKTILSCKTEAERIRALSEHFGISLTDEQRDGIKGRNVELRE